MHEVSGIMEERSAGGRAMTRREIMTRMRSQALLVRRLEEQMKELCPDGLRSIRIGGAGGGGHAPARGLDVQIQRKEAVERMLTREKARLAQYEAAARQEMAAMKPGEYAFSLMYYIGGYSLEETSRMIDRSVRQCERYRGAILRE